MENTQKNIFITGRAGTGKSTLLDYFQRSAKKKVVVLAPTGVAALNVKGQTIHSFFRFKPDITLKTIKKERRKIYKKLDAIVIDETSMVRADLLDCIDKFMRLNGKTKNLPFGGVQMIFFGDLYQLPPVVTGKETEIFNSHYKSPYFFDAHVFENFEMEFLELEKIYRQKDEKFIDILNKIRNNSATDEDLEKLNKRFDPNFEDKLDDFYIYLTTTNKKAEEINRKQLNKIPKKTSYYEGIIKGDFSERHLPTAIDLKLKIGAQVMLLNNDAAGRWVNGSIGKIIDIKYDDYEENDAIIVKLTSGETVDATPYKWEIFHFYYDKRSHSIEAETVGSFTQYPMKLAWAITIHKSQGKTFERVILDIDRGTFAHGQMYVAISRCTSLDGLVLKKKIEKKHILMDWRIVKFVTKYQYQISDKKCSLDTKIDLIRQAVKNSQDLQITYLKANDEKSRRRIRPSFVGDLEYLGKPFLGVEAYCCKRQKERVFRVDRILEIK